MNPLLWPRWAQGLALIAAGVAAFLAWDRLDDRAAVRDHETKVAAEVTATVLEAERMANRNDQARRATRQSRTEELKRAREEAIHENSDEAGHMAGPAVRAVLRELRTQADQDSGPAS